MRVGITTDLRFSMFSSGHANSCLSVASIFQAMGHEIILLHRQAGQTWWDDLTELAAEKAKCVLLDDFLKQQNPLDLVIEICYNLSPLMRSKVATRVVWYNRKPGLFSDIEATVYGCRPDGRNLEGVSAIWTADLFTRSDDLVYLQTLYPTIPIYNVPWTWTPDIVEAHRSAMKAPVWSQVYQLVPPEAKWSVHIAESNMSSTSSCTLPLVIMRNSCLNKQMPISQVIIHNTELLKDNQFFKENVLAHCNLPDVPYNFFGRQRIIDWINDPKSIVLSHNRFVPLKMANLEAIWVGLPLIHNSTVLRDMGCGLELLYYDGNSVTGATEALNRVLYNTKDIPYLLDLEKLGELRKKILEAFYPLTHVQGWAVAFERTMTFAKPVPLAKPVPVALVKPKAQTEKAFRVLFTDMWDQFNPDHNMFILALQAALNIPVNGYSLDTMPQTGRIDLAIFGPFGEDWKRLPTELPKVHFTGENTGPINDPSVKLNIGYELPAMSDDTYLRMPLWQFEIDWFGADINQIRNPLPLPIDTCTKVSLASEKRSKFCAFVVTNPKNPIRNQAFHTLNKYKAVDSAGRLYNNMGNQIFAGLGGGGGELKKHAFLENYRFCIAYENASAPGYTTEKLLHAKAAGCIPIYWGDPKIARDFNEKGFLNANNCKTAEDLVALVDSVERDETLMSAMRSVPALTSYQRDLVRRNFAEMVRRFVTVAGRTELLSRLPKFIGAKTSEEADAMRLARSGTTLKSTLFLTGVTQKFWHCLPRWIESVQDKGSVRVYVGGDVPQTDLDVIRTTYKTTEFIPFPIKMVPSMEFKDFWTPSHYAWKLFILEKTACDESIKGSLVFYMDVGSTLVNEPTEWMQHARIHGVSLLNDVRQKNRNWCHEVFCKSLSLTDAEKDSQQIAACLILFVAGHPTAVQLLNQCLVLGTHREIIVGEKWSGVGPDGKPFGHRHDQSILSIVSQRLGIHRVPIDTVYCDVSRKATQDLGKAVYVHRGAFKESEVFLPGIDQAHVINLDRRKDRMESFMSTESHVYLQGRVRRLAAYDGRSLQLTPELRILFKPNDFFWKKAVMGCAMSHLKLWTKLANGNENAYFILEDDARLEPEWMEAWLKAYPSLPADWDCVYLGGILPPNRTTFNTTLEPVADGLARVAMNKIFGQPVPTRYFHFCAYAYVLSKAGAKKILETIKEKGGYWTSADHMICNRVDRMNLYVINPLVAGASQDSDPAYQTAQFNNFSRIDNFDSDLWNNDDRFTTDEISGVTSIAPAAIHEGPRFICLNTCMENGSKLYEANWLQDLFQTTKFNVESVSATDTLSKSDNLIVVLIKPQWAEQLAWLEVLRSAGYRFKILHLSDEFGTDPIHMYSWPEVTGVLRFYNRPNLPSKVLVIPLGYHRQFRGNRDVPHMSTPNLPFRDNMWSFVGTDWKDRSKDMEILNAIQPSYVRWFSEWRDPAQLKDEEYVALLLNTKCVPCPRGQNVETYRFYEALDCGCIPLFIYSEDNEAWLQVFHNELPLIKLEGWNHVAALMQHFQKNPEQMEQYRMTLLIAWAKYKATLKEGVRNWLENKKIDA